MVREVSNILMASESKKLDYTNTNLKCSHVSHEVFNLIPLAMNMCPLKVGDERDGLYSIGNEEFVDDGGHESDIEFEVMMMFKEFDIDLSYERAWRAQKAALSMVRKSLRESYGLLARYGEALKIVNHRTHYNLEVEPDGHFKYVYMALEAYI
ncbi:MuDRA-like transposase [Cucumis melo var. makuwa]|uniref:MuDRA-like transposase n=1 Tax=Cucumis melo var. makuwa TaxID=1194695 RepID=A0A5D3E646_CUCMM|nr:MuDRA-like transposase [Cucumis melo var. makuwa]TYK31607.1 MuDRA-like transposase [Cucumis melo var. makuwa]